jgi:hypothetical protein
MKLRLLVKLPPCTGIDQNQLAPGIDEEGVIRHFDGIRETVLRKAVFDLLWGRGWQYPHCRIGDRAIALRS